MVLAITPMVVRLPSIPSPVVAAVNGHALGAELGITEAQAGIAFAAGPLEIMRHELAGELLRRLTLTSAVLILRELFLARILVCSAGLKISNSAHLVLQRAWPPRPDFTR